MLLPLISWAWPESAIAIALTIVLAIVIRWVIGRAIRMGVNASLKHSADRAQAAGGRAGQILADLTGASNARHEARTKTVGSVLHSITSVTVFTVAILTILALFDVPLGPILASAGIGGVALGFGAQSLVKDYLSGIFMILEDQYGVGDIVNLGEVTGTVEEVGLRITRVRDGSGQVWYIRNGEITRVGNQSQGWSTAVVDVPVASTADAGEVIAILERVVAEADADPRWQNILLDKPNVAGVNEVRGGTMTIRVNAKCAPNQQWGVQRDLLERSVSALNAAGVPGPPVITPPLGAS